MSTEQLALVVALVAVFFGPLVQLSIANKQIRVATRSTNRQDWINALRDEISEFLGHIANLDFMLELKDNEPYDEIDEDIDELGQALYYHYYKVQLLINPEEKDHEELHEKMNAIENVLWEEKMGKKKRAERLSELMAELTGISQRVLKREWKRVKKGD